MSLREIAKRFKVARNGERVTLAWQLVRELAKFSREEPFWEFVRGLGLKPETAKEAMLFLEERGELDIKRSRDGKRLWVSTLRDIRENPIKLDRWLKLTSRRQPMR